MEGNINQVLDDTTKQMQQINTHIDTIVSTQNIPDNISNFAHYLNNQGTKRFEDITISDEHKNAAIDGLKIPQDLDHLYKTQCSLDILCMRLCKNTDNISFYNIYDRVHSKPFSTEGCVSTFSISTEDHCYYAICNYDNDGEKAFDNLTFPDNKKSILFCTLSSSNEGIAAHTISIVLDPAAQGNKRVLICPTTDHTGHTSNEECFNHVQMSAPVTFQLISKWLGKEVALNNVELLQPCNMWRNEVCAFAAIVGGIRVAYGDTTLQRTKQESLTKNHGEPAEENFLNRVAQNYIDIAQLYIGNEEESKQAFGRISQYVANKPAQRQNTEEPTVIILEANLEEVKASLQENTTLTQTLTHAEQTQALLKEAKQYATADLFEAVRENDINRAKTLIKIGGADINHRDAYNGNTPLHIAAQYNNKEMVDLLIENGADVTVVNNRKMAPVEMTENQQIKEAIWNELHKQNEHTNTTACVDIENGASSNEQRLPIGVNNGIPSIQQCHQTILPTILQNNDGKTEGALRARHRPVSGNAKVQTTKLNHTNIHTDNGSQQR